MDATTSNRISRGLFAASQGVNQMINIRMQMADKLFKEKLQTMQMQQHAQDRADTQSYRQANLARQDKAENARESEAAARQKTSEANSASMIQERADNQRDRQAQLAIAMQNLGYTKQRLELAISEHADKMSSTELDKATKSFQALSSHVKNLQAQANNYLKYASPIYNTDAASRAKSQTLYDSTMANINDLNQRAMAYVDTIGKLSGVQTPSGTKPLPKLGGKYIKLSNGSYAPYDPNNVPEGLNPKMAPIGTPRDQLQTGDVYTFDKPGIHMPSGAVVPMGQMPGTSAQPDD